MPKNLSLWSLRIAKNNPRPRKYANDAERQEAYRNRYAVFSIRVAPKTAETLEKISAETRITRAEIVNQMILFALVNRDWRMEGQFSKALTTQSQDDRRRGTKYVTRDEDDET